MVPFVVFLSVKLWPGEGAMEYFGAFFDAFFLRTFGYWVRKRMDNGIARVLVASVVTLAATFGLVCLASGITQSMLVYLPI